eukprot:4476760-Alexandrium_andersonii.AAC.1
MKPEFEGYARLQVAIDSGAAASVIRERLLEGRRVAPSVGPARGVRLSLIHISEPTRLALI